MNVEPSLPQEELAPDHLGAALRVLLEMAVSPGLTLSLAPLCAERAAAIQQVGRGGGVRVLAVESLYNSLAGAAQVANRPAAERVRAVAGNAARLRGHSRLAHETLTLARLLEPGHSAEYLRVLGLVFWEEGSGSAAMAVLERAERLFCTAGEALEVLDTRRLRTLLHAELGDHPETLWLAGTTAPAVVTTRPWLGARTALTEAFCLAARGGASDRQEARMLLAQGEELTEAVGDEAERLHLAWLATRARARLRRDAGVAGDLAALLPAAVRLWPEGDRHLLCLDLCMSRTPGRQALDLQRVAAELGSTATEEAWESVIEPALEAVRLLADPGLPAWDLAAAVARQLRTFARLAQPAGLRPIPFRVHWPAPRAEAPGSEETH